MRGHRINYWPSLADMILSILIIVLILGFVQNVCTTAERFQAVSAERRDEEAWREVDAENARLRGQVAEMESRLRDLAVELERLRELETAYRRDKPPIITLDEARGYSFRTASAALSEEFARAIDGEIIPRLCGIFEEYGVDVVEVIGHTDGQPAGRGIGNLDVALESVAAGVLPVEALVFGSNADLGLMRAVAVARRLRESGRLAGHVQIRVYSAAQLLLPDGTISPPYRNDDPSRRRIELRFTKLTP